MLDSKLLEAALESKNCELPLLLYDKLESTNVEAKRLVKDGKLPDGGIIITDSQSAGRGRMGRTWVAADGKDLTFTIAFKNYLDRIDIPKTGLSAALGLCHALEKEYGITAHLRWPNDILVDNKKLAGILSEYVMPEDFILVGMGINVNSDDSDWDFPAYTRPTSLKLIKGEKLEREPLLAACAKAVDSFLPFARWEYFPTFQTLYETRAFYGNMRVTVHLDAYSEHPGAAKVELRNDKSRVIEGTALGIDRYGALRVRDDEGTDHTVRAGDMVMEKE